MAREDAVEALARDVIEAIIRSGSNGMRAVASSFTDTADTVFSGAEVARILYEAAQLVEDEMREAFDLPAPVEERPE